MSERVAWAIKIIARDKDLDEGITDVALAKILGTNKDTLATYRKGQGLLKGEVIENLVVKYNFSPQWLFRGEGEPFPGARAKYPEVCGPVPHAQEKAYYVNNKFEHCEIRETSVEYEPAEIKISDLLHKTVVILESQTIYRQALRSNIEAFYHSLTCEAHLEEFKKKMGDQERRAADQERRITELENKIRYLTDLQEGSLSTAS